MNDAVALNERFSIPGEVSFLVDDHGALVAQITNAGGAGSVAIQGAQLLTWAEQGAKFGDMGEDGYRHMLCVETTNAASDAVTVPPSETYQLITDYAVEPFA